MASCCSRARNVINRAPLSSIKSAIRSNTPRSPVAGSLPTPSPSPVRRLSLSRNPSELRCMASMLPLHSAVSAARMTSCLSITSRSCRALLQGTLCCTSPGL